MRQSRGLYRRGRLRVKTSGGPRLRKVLTPLAARRSLKVMERTTRSSACLVLAAAACLAACTPARAGFSDILNRVKDRVGSALLAHDVLAEPGTEVTLEAGLRSGLRLTGEEGRRIQFHLDERRLGEVPSDTDGNAAVRWTAPETCGDYVIRVRIKPDDQPDKPVEETQLLVAVRKPDTPMVVVDLDKTVVASGFAWVLLGGAKPMTGANVVLERLAKAHTIVYLTHRPDFLGPKSKRWLTENRFPTGPVLTSTLGGFLKGSGDYKAGRIASLKRTYPNLAVGIGDKISDARAYADHGLASILILHVDWSEDDPEDYEKLVGELASLPQAVHVVTNWSDVSAILFEKATRPKQAMEARLRQVARDLRRRRKD